MINVIIIIDIFVNFVSETVRDMELVIYLKDAALLYLKSYFLISSETFKIYKNLTLFQIFPILGKPGVKYFPGQ